MARGPIIPSAVDLTDSGNVVQARHELHQAIDFGGATERAAWAEKWGEAALAAGEKAARAGDEWDGFSPPFALEQSLDAIPKLETELGKEAPDLKACARFASRVRSKLGDMMEAHEE